MMRVVGSTSFALLAMMASFTVAQDVRPTETKANTTYTENDQKFSIARIEDRGRRLTGAGPLIDALLPDACSAAGVPGFCGQMDVADALTLLICCEGPWTGTARPLTEG